MRARLAGVVLAAAVLAAACSDDEPETLDVEDFGVVDEAASTTSTTGLADLPLPPPVGDAVELRLTLPSRVKAAPFTWPIQLRNTTRDPIAVTFSTSQSVDIVLTSSAGVEVYRWSTGRFFEQSVRQVTVEGRSSVPLDIGDDLTAVPPGFYEVTVSLTNTDPPEPLETSIRIVKA